MYEKYVLLIDILMTVGQSDVEVATPVLTLIHSIWCQSVTRMLKLQYSAMLEEFNYALFEQYKNKINCLYTHLRQN